MPKLHFSFKLYVFLSLGIKYKKIKQRGVAEKRQVSLKRMFAYFAFFGYLYTVYENFGVKLSGQASPGSRGCGNALSPDF
jgi:hypothetical protein